MRAFVSILLTALVSLVGCAGHHEPGSLRVVSYNIKHGRGMDGVVDLERAATVLEGLDADLVALQEVDVGCTRSGGVDLAHALGDRLGMSSRFAKFMDYQGGAYGLAILSRLPIVATHEHEQPPGAEPRRALEVVVEHAAFGRLSFVCLHHDWTDEDFRVRQMHALLAGLDDRRHPVILAGDFNGERSDRSMQMLDPDRWTVLVKHGTPATFPSDEPRREIDYVAIRRLAAATIEHRVIDERLASDHRPVLAIFDR